MTVVHARPTSRSQFDVAGDAREAVANSIVAPCADLPASREHSWPVNRSAATKRRFLAGTASELVTTSTAAGAAPALPASDSAVSATSFVVSIEVVVDDHAAASVCREVSAALQTASVQDELCVDVELLVTELVSDIIRDIFRPDDAQTVGVDVNVAVRAVSTTTARDLAADTVEPRTAVALTACEAIAAAEATAHRLHEVNRRLHRAGLHDRVVALALQDAMLTRLPTSADLLLAARYLTAAEEDQVGGDWYDALVLPTGRTSLIIGDVIGHDIEAAATMGQLRNILRALVWDRDEAPAAVVGRLDRAIRELHIDTIATVVLATVGPPAPDDPTSVATLQWSNAGHPAPVLIHADGTAIALDATTDVLLGVQPDTVRRDHHHRVPPGATLLLYTDGLVETRTHAIDDGQLRLLDAARTHHRRELGELLDAVISEMVGDRPRDDVAVLAARFPGTLTSAQRI